MRAFALAISLSLICLNSFASDSDRITQLEKEVQELKLRLANLEAPKSKINPDQKPVASSEGWKSVSNWRLLKKGMSYDQVKATLGEPARVQGGSFTYWFYPNRSGVTFYEDKLDSWVEPR
jgi:hypothetical protein